MGKIGFTVVKKFSVVPSPDLGEIGADLAEIHTGPREECFLTILTVTQRHSDVSRRSFYSARVA